MSDAATCLDDIARYTGELDRLTKAMAEAVADLNEAEKDWDEHYDAVMADLEDEFANAGRKSVPEHTAISAARRSGRDKYVRWQNAKRRVERQQRQLKAISSSISGKQSELNGLRDEARNQDYAAQHQPVQTFGARRAA